MKRSLLRSSKISNSSKLLSQGSWKVSDWDVQTLLTIVWHNSYRIPMFTDRDFLTAIYTPPPQNSHSFIVFSRPVLHPDAPPQEHHTRGIYESVEFVRDLGDEGIEWLMA